MDDPRVGVELGLRPGMAGFEQRAERRHHETTIWFQGLHHPLQHQRVVASHQTEPALAERDHRIELVLERHLARVDLEEGRTHSSSARVFSRELQEPPRHVDPRYRETGLRETDGMSSRAAPDV